MAMQRSRSMPLVNPFWSSRTQEALRVAASRPMDLPRVPTDDELEEQVEPIQEGPEVGAARREWSRLRASTVASREGPQLAERFATPGTSLQTPSSWSMPEPVGIGPKTEGPLPASAEPASANEGLGDGQSHLERDLGQLMFEQLQEENHLLRLQLEAAKRKHEGGDGSVFPQGSGLRKHEEQPRPPPPKTPRLHGSDHHVGNQHKFTPGGTRVPDGPPPETEEHDEQKQTLLPAWPPSLESYAGCDREERKGAGRMGDGPPAPWMREADRLVMSPRQARMARLEREVWAMRDALKEESRRHDWSSYWRKPSHRWSSGESPEPVPPRDGPERRLGDGGREGDRALHYEVH